MKLDRKLKRRIAVGIAILLILYGVLGEIFNFKLDTKLTNDISMVLLIIAFALLFSDWRKKPDQNTDSNTVNEIKSSETKSIESELNEKRKNDTEEENKLE